VFEQHQAQWFKVSAIRVWRHTEMHRRSARNHHNSRISHLTPSAVVCSLSASSAGSGSGWGGYGKRKLLRHCR